MRFVVFREVNRRWYFSTGLPFSLIVDLPFQTESLAISIASLPCLESDVSIQHHNGTSIYDTRLGAKRLGDGVAM